MSKSRTLDLIASIPTSKEAMRDLMMRSLPREAAHARHNRLARKHSLAEIARRDGAGTPPRSGVPKIELRAAKAEDRRQHRLRRLDALKVCAAGMAALAPPSDGCPKQREQALRGSRLLT